MDWAGLQNQLPQKQKISAVELGSEHDNTMSKWRREPSTGQMADSNYFYSEKSILCTNFHAHVTPFTCMVVIVHTTFEDL